jgi:hypothetical protein
MESHVEPVDENTVHVIMPDGWTFVFYRNGNTDTWRGNAGWVGETDGVRFTITAPCGWRVKFDAGKILEIDTPKNRTISIKYNGPAPLEADIDNQPFVQVAQNTTTGVAESITIVGQKIAISQAPRPRISTILNKTLLTGFDPALSQLQWPDGSKELFDFSVTKELTPTLIITKSGHSPRTFTWNPVTGQIQTDGEWTYHLTEIGYVTIERKDIKGNQEKWYHDTERGVTDEASPSTGEVQSTFFSSGPLAGRLRKIEIIEGGKSRLEYRATYDEVGNIVREERGTGEVTKYGKDLTETFGKHGEMIFVETRSVMSGNTQQDNGLTADSIQDLSLIEKDWKGKVERSNSPSDEDIAKLAYFYIFAKQDRADALRWASRAQDKDVRFNILLHAIEYDANLSPLQKAQQFAELKLKNPQKATCLNPLMEAYAKQVTNKK